MPNWAECDRLSAVAYLFSSIQPMDNAVVATASQGDSLIVRGKVGKLSNDELITLMERFDASTVVLCASDGTTLGTFSLVVLQQVYD